MDRERRTELELRLRRAVLVRRERLTGRRQGGEPAAAAPPAGSDEALDRLRACLERLQGSLRDLGRAMGETEGPAEEGRPEKSP